MLISFQASCWPMRYLKAIEAPINVTGMQDISIGRLMVSWLRGQCEWQTAACSRSERACTHDTSPDLFLAMDSVQSLWILAFNRPSSTLIYK